MTTNAHTPTPWRIASDEPRKIVSDSIYGLDPLTGENLVGGASVGPYAQANAAFIVLAVNAHEELVAALRGAMTVIDLLPVPYEIGSEVSNAIASRREKARAILAKLEAAA